MKHIKHLIQKILAVFNLRLQFIRDYSTSATLDKLKISLLIDVGANIGQFALEVREKGYRGLIVSFEPLVDAHSQLLNNSARDENWRVYPRCAVGDFDGEIEIHVAGNSYSSSIREMLPSHMNAAPDSVPIGSDSAEIVRLDSLIDEWSAHQGNIYLKVDTQGFEREVLTGAAKTLRLVTAVQLEMSIVELYKGQSLFDYFFDYLKSENFDLYQIIPGFLDPESGQLLQFDAVFVRRKTEAS
jgi:FkbM family methyltransferase